jgi:hypothetical protein
MEARFGPFGDSVYLVARFVHGLHQTCNRLINRFWRTRWNSLVMWVKWKLASVRLEMVLFSAQDSCMVCAECNTGRKSFWPHPMDLLGVVHQMESHFGPFGDSVYLNARLVHDLH